MCVYGLDCVLSIALGRPCGAHDDDRDVEMRKSSLSSPYQACTATRKGTTLTDLRLRWFVPVAAELDDAQLFATCEGSTASPAGTTSIRLAPRVSILYNILYPLSHLHCRSLQTCGP